jgi:hypothetical protein
MSNEFSRIEIPDDLKDDFDSNRSAIKEINIGWSDSKLKESFFYILKNPKVILEWLLVCLVIKVTFTKGFSLEILKEIIK